MLRSLLIIFIIFLPSVAGAIEASDTELIPMGLKVMAALAVVLGLMLLFYAVLKKSGRWIRSGKDSAIKLLEVRYLAPKKALYLIEVNGSKLLLSGTGSRLEALAQWPETSADTPAGAVTAAAFDATLKQRVALQRNQDS